MKKLLIGLIAGAALMVGGVAYAAPSIQHFNDVAPYVTNTYTNGTAALQWLNFFTQNASTTNLSVTGQSTGCAQFSASGALTSTGVTCASSGSAFPFTPQTLGNATGTLLLLNGGIIAAASSTIGNGLQQGGLTISGGATTTGNSFYGTGTALWTVGPDANNSNAYSLLSAGMTYPAFVLSSTGNLGIGSTTPDALVSILDTSGFSSVSPHLVFEIGSSSPSQANTTNFVINSQGNVGIGTSSPSNLLVVGNTDLGYQGNFIGETIGNTGNNSILKVGQDATHQVQFVWNYNATAASSTAQLVTYGYSNPIQIDGSILELQTNSHGKVGIGTTSPYAALSVVGSTGVVADHYVATSTATSTFAGGLSLTGGGLKIGTVPSCSGSSALTTDSSGTVGCGTISGTGGASFAWTPTTYSGNAVNATSTSLWLKGTNLGLIASSTFFTTASTTNLEMTYYVQEYPGANLGSQFNNAYAAAPNGSTFVISASSTFATAMTMGTSGKVGTIKCSPGVVLTWTGAATSTILNPTDLNNLQAGWGMTGCTIKGTGGAGQVLIQLGGSNGAQGAVLANLDLANAGTGLRTEQNTWNINVNDSWFGGLNQAVHIESANNSGEGFRWNGDTFVDCNSNYGDCFYSEVNGTDGMSMYSPVFDDAGIHLLDGNLNASLHSPKWENPNAAVIGRYTYGTFDSGGFMQVSIYGGTAMNGADTLGHSPNQFFLNGAQLSIYGLSLDNNTGGAISVPALVNNFGNGTVTVYSYKDVNSGTKTVTIVATSSTPFFVDSNYANGIGAIGIGTSTPQADIEAWNSGTNVQAFITRKDGAELHLKAQDTQVRQVFCLAATCNSDTNLFFDSDNSGTTRLSLSGGGDLGLNTSAVHALINGVTSTSTILEITKTGKGTIGPVLQLNNDGDSSLGDKYLISMIDGASGGGLFRGAILGTLNGTGQLQMDFMTGTSGSTTPLGLTKMFSILPNGRIGVATTTPFAKFAIHANAVDTNTTLFAIASSTASATTTLYYVTNTGAMFAPNTLTQSGAATDYWCYDSSGQFIRVSNTCTVSALKFKKDITPLDPSQGLDAVLAMKPVNYYLNDLGLVNSTNPDDTRKQIGFVADYADTVVPSLVLHDSNGDIHGFNYEQYTANLTLAIQQLNEKIQNISAPVTKSVQDTPQDVVLVLIIGYLVYDKFKKKV